MHFSLIILKFLRWRSQITVNGAVGDFVDLQVVVGDDLPASPLCLKRLIEFNDFINICQKSVGELRNFSCRKYLRVAVGDGLPGSLCPLCLEKLIEFNDFRNVCHKSDAELRNFSCINYLRRGGPL
ncbi:uncharacterized protein LOC124170339 [Ischnura elegans]|uniref:uncharacterized protein LOC124170339 n=1 Tax=Ischnura elegans TaxID=197161 RepID=UPI001ED89122|nr:uncharacterized protein LOC124170339 [Ischnura elegans]